MRKISLFICLAALGFVTQGQVKSNSNLKVFNQAASTGDISTAITALNYYVIETGANPVYEDTLAMLYMQRGGYAQSFFWADKRLKINPGNNSLLEIKGLSLEKLQDPKEAINVFESLYSRTKSPYHAYKLMELQYGIKRLVECLNTGTSAEKLEYKPEYLMTYTVGEQTGRTYLQAGIYNIMALTLYDLDKKAEAKMYLEKALALDSTFLLAKQNLSEINALQKDNNKADINNTSTPSSPANKQN